MRIRELTGITFDDVLLVPKKTNIESRTQVDLTSRLTPKIKLSIPVVSANMDTVTESTMAIAVAEAGGIGIIHRFLTIDAEAEKVARVKKKGLIVGAAIGVREDYLARTEALLNAGADVIVIDIAHGHSLYLIKVLKDIKKKFPKAEIIAGNIATGEAAEELIKNGADAVKVGIGPGSICITRLVAGAGVPQVTAIDDVVKVARKYKTPVIADGGIRTSGDIVKALATGASTVMIGSIFAGAEESPTVMMTKEGKKFKLTRGMASLAAYLDNHEKNGNGNGEKNGNGVEKDLATYAAEGVEAMIPYRGHAQHIIAKLAGGMRSGFSYCGAVNIEELWKNAEFIRISNSALIESHSHDVLEV